MFVRCLHPKIFLNPALRQLLALHGSFSMAGREYSNFFGNSILLPRRSSLKRFRRLLPSLSPDELDDYFVIGRDGFRYPIYMVSRCNHCILCTESKHNEYASRLLAESQLYNVPPVFVTLSYRDSHLPDAGVSLRDCQTFLKRLRINLIRKLHYNEKIRYFLVSEYGQDDRYTHRPHYHVIFFNLPVATNTLKWQTRDLVCSSWSHGFIQMRVVDMHNPSCFLYTSKYLYKDQVVPDGKHKPFALSSRAGGGIGSRFFARFRDYMYKYRPSSLKYTDKFTGAIRDIPLSQYVMGKILPTFNQSLSLRCRNAAKSFAALFTQFQNFDFVNNFRSLYDDLIANTKDYFCLPDSFKRSKVLSCAITASEILPYLAGNICSWLYNTDFDYFKQLEYARKDVYQKVFATLVPLSSTELEHEAVLLQSRRNLKQSKKILHHV